MTPMARATDPSTSHDPADSVENVLNVQHGILNVIARWGPKTDEDIAHLYKGPKASPSGLRTRRKELVAAGILRDSGRKQRLASGRSGIRWEIDPSC